MSTKVLVVGASRGVGLALVEDLKARPDVEVIAGVRSDANPTLQSLNVQIATLDMTNAESLSATAQQIPELDILIINAGMGDKEKILSSSTERLREYLETNVIGTHNTILAFLPALRKGKAKKIILLSSQSGSMERQVNATRGFSGPYAVSKAGVNMLAIQYHNELNGDGFTVVPVHPGWVNTDMGKIAGDGGMQPAVSAKGIVDLTLRLKTEDSAKFFMWDGSILPW